MLMLTDDCGAMQETAVWDAVKLMCLMQEDTAPVGKGWRQPGRREDDADIPDAILAARWHQATTKTDGESIP